VSPEQCSAEVRPDHSGAGSRWRVHRDARSWPYCRTVVALLKKLRPDVVLVSPTIWPKAPVEVDYIYAARSLGIPTGGYANSWDNRERATSPHATNVRAGCQQALKQRAAAVAIAAYAHKLVNWSRLRSTILLASSEQTRPCLREPVSNPPEK
jgi:hypothetical protein